MSHHLAGAGRQGIDAAQCRERCLRLQPLLVVTNRNNQGGGDVHTDAVGVAQLRAVLHGQLIQLRQGLLEFLIQLLNAAGKSAQGHLGCRQRRADLSRAQATAAFHQLLALEPLQPLPQRCRCSHNNRVQLIEGCRAVARGRILDHLEHADHLHQVIACLGNDGRLAGNEGAGSCLRVDGVVLTSPVPGGTIRPVHFHHLKPC